MFREDMSTIYDRNAAENMAIVRHLAVNLLQRTKNTYPKASIRRLQRRSIIQDNFLTAVFSEDFSAFPIISKTNRRRSAKKI